MAFVTSPSRRAVVAVVVIGLHALAVLAFLRMTLQHEAQETGRERVYWLSLKVRPKLQIVPIVRPRARSTISVPALVPLPRPNVPTLPQASPGAEALKGLHLNFFNCGLDNLANLPPEERAQCELTLKRFDDRSVDFADRTNRSKNARHWARRVARKQNPLLLPCASPEAAGVSLWTMYCLGNGILNGFDLDEMPGYGDKPPPPEHWPNNGDPLDPRK